MTGAKPVKRIVATVFDVIVYLERDSKNGRRRVSEVLKVNGVLPSDEYDIEVVPC